MSGLLQRAGRLSWGVKAAVVAGLILSAGLLLGTLLDANAGIPQPWNRVSSALGWLSFVCWSAEFYPQVVLNYKRKSTEGYSLDSAVLALLGFASYAVFNAAFYYSERVQQAYMALHDGHRSAVELNDVFFSLHASTLVAVAIIQCWAYPSGDQHISRTTKMVATATVAVALALAAGSLLSSHLPGYLPTRLNVLDVLYYLSYVKLGSTLMKELPQLLLNHRRRSTRGWTVETVLLDMPGCVLSIAQQVLDSWATSDWSAITGNPVKLALALASLGINSVYVLQHYVWFKDAHAESEATPLLPVSTKSASRVTPTFKAAPAWVTRASRAYSEHAVDKVFWDASAELTRV